MCPDAADFLQDGIRSEQLGVLDRALDGYMAAAAFAGDADLRSRALTHQSIVLRTQCQWTSAIAVARRSREIALQAGLATRAAEATIAEANVFMARGEFEHALPLFHQLLGTVDDARVRGVALQNIASIHAQRGALAEAEASFADSFRCFEQVGYVRGQAIARINLGRMALDRGAAETAALLLESALLLAREIDDGELAAATLINLAEALLPSQLARAEELVCTALGHVRVSGNHLRQVECLHLLGIINEIRGYVEQAQACYVHGLALAREIDARSDAVRIAARLHHVREAGAAPHLAPPDPAAESPA